MIELGFKPAAWKLFMGNLMHKIYPKWSEKSGLDTEAISSLIPLVKRTGKTRLYMMW